jgi:F0F1-type ATP synthase membrane subunit c/vacuolar-type H+-ATPase subunit K
MRRKVLEIGGIVAAVVLIGFGVAAIVLGATGRNTVKTALSEQKITGTPDMTPQAIKAEAAKAGLNVSTLAIPSCSVANEAVDTGSKARCFAQYMNIHALEATGGLYYSQMPRYATADGKGTNEEAAALKTPAGKPVENPARNVWIDETALSTALNTSYMADQTSIFGIVVGIALLLSGVGFAILAAGGALRSGRSRLLPEEQPERSATPDGTPAQSTPGELAPS